MRTVRCALLCLLLSSSQGVTAKYPWEEEPASRWARDFSHSARDSRVPLPTTPLEQEGIGEKITVHDLFDRWILNESVSGGRGKHFTEVTKDCKGKIELDFALTPTQWQNRARQKRYYRSVDRLVIKVGRQLLADFGNQLSGREKAAFMRALHALAWQETLWQHSIRYKNWFFVVVSGTSYIMIVHVRFIGPSATSVRHERRLEASGACRKGNPSSCRARRCFKVARRLGHHHQDEQPPHLSSAIRLRELGHVGLREWWNCNNAQLPPAGGQHASPWHQTIPAEGWLVALSGHTNANRRV